MASYCARNDASPRRPRPRTDSRSSSSDRGSRIGPVKAKAVSKISVSKNVSSMKTWDEVPGALGSGNVSRPMDAAGAVAFESAGPRSDRGGPPRHSWPVSQAIRPTAIARHKPAATTRNAVRIATPSARGARQLNGRRRPSHDRRETAARYVGHITPRISMSTALEKGLARRRSIGARCNDDSAEDVGRGRPRYSSPTDRGR